jgi:hypothetical protein
MFEDFKKFRKKLLKDKSLAFCFLTKILPLLKTYTFCVCSVRISISSSDEGKLLETSVQVGYLLFILILCANNQNLL